MTEEFDRLAQRYDDTFRIGTLSGLAFPTPGQVLAALTTAMDDTKLYGEVRLGIIQGTAVALRTMLEAKRDKPEAAAETAV